VRVKPSRITLRLLSLPCAAAAASPLCRSPLAGDSSCEVSLTQVRVPLADAHENGDQEKQVLQGWRDRIFGGIQKFVGIAMEREED
jgi:hypothetical protein